MIYETPWAQGAQCSWYIPPDCSQLVFKSTQLTELNEDSFKANPPVFDGYFTNITNPGDGILAACINVHGEQGQWSVRQCEPEPPPWIPAPEPGTMLLMFVGLVTTLVWHRWRTR